MTVCCCRCFCETTNAWIKINKKRPEEIWKSTMCVKFFLISFVYNSCWCCCWVEVTNVVRYVTFFFFLQIFCCCCYYDVSLAHAQNNTQQVFFLFLVVDVSLITFVGGMQMMLLVMIYFHLGFPLSSYVSKMYVYWRFVMMITITEADVNNQIMTKGGIAWRIS